MSIDVNALSTMACDAGFCNRYTVRIGDCISDISALLRFDGICFVKTGCKKIMLRNNDSDIVIRNIDRVEAFKRNDKDHIYTYRVFYNTQDIEYHYCDIMMYREMIL